MSELKFLTKSEILAIDDIKTEIVEVKEWGGKVLVRAMNATQRDAFEVGHMDKSLKNYRAFVACRVVCDEKGEPLFSESEMLHLGKKSAKALDRVYEVAIRLSGITKEEEEQLEKL